jgi:rhodanese-related sulfurtransferase
LPGVTTEELASRLKAPFGPEPLLLDVRGEEEYAVSHLKGAKNISMDDSELMLPLGREAAVKGAPIIVYCSVGYRSSKVVRQLDQAGLCPVFSLEGGLFQWANEERFMISEGGPVKDVHPYSAAWGKLLKANHFHSQKQE